MDNSRGIVLCGILAAIYIGIDIPYNYLFWPSPARSLTYHFLHVNIFHLIANCFCLWQLCKRGLASNKRLITAYIIASLIPPVGCNLMIGFSNILYVLTGMAFFSINRKSMGIFILATACMILFPQIAGIPHFIALVAGIIIAFINNRLQRLDSDFRAAAY